MALPKAFAVFLAVLIGIVVILETLISVIPVVSYSSTLVYSTVLLLPQLMSAAFARKGQPVLLMIFTTLVIFAAGNFTALLKSVEELFFIAVGFHHDHGVHASTILGLDRNSIYFVEIAAILVSGVIKLFVLIALSVYRKMEWIVTVMTLVPSIACVAFLGVIHFKLELGEVSQLLVEASISAFMLILAFVHIHRSLLPFLLSSAPETKDIDVKRVLQDLSKKFNGSARIAHAHLHRIFPKGFVAFTQIIAQRGIDARTTISVLEDALVSAGATKVFCEVVFVDGAITQTAPICIRHDCHTSEVGCCVRALQLQPAELDEHPAPAKPPRSPLPSVKDAPIEAENSVKLSLEPILKTAEKQPLIH